MKLLKAKVQNFRSIKDTGFFDLEELKTILVGPNEAGKTVILKALQQLNKPKDVAGFDALRDYPRSLYNDINTGKVEPEKVVVVTGIFGLVEEDKTDIPESFHNCKYKLIRKLDNKAFHELIDAPPKVKYSDIKMICYECVLTWIANKSYLI
jgi:AAA15 family ATPase/GTPase